MAIYNNNNAMRAVTSRFSLSDYMALLAEAERTGSNPSQLLRQTWCNPPQNPVNTKRVKITLFQSTLFWSIVNGIYQNRGYNYGFSTTVEQPDDTRR
ncbi:hypothetical protein [Photobacterium sp. 1_MG-2023]|uniref:hypothetical protein n=1 Tax=Photobacterium sp. 1_MG-2023 TaxID=3062646 RepID=UPI0026E444DF|nr:hypothetical protein [Photobacterium sp. 1_MG-2023]MDO6708983.1 hypothetical protein [Photobacterium sp. 1_MG-2023]